MCYRRYASKSESDCIFATFYRSAPFPLFGLPASSVSLGGDCNARGNRSDPCCIGRSAAADEPRMPGASAAQHYSVQAKAPRFSCHFTRHSHSASVGCVANREAKTLGAWKRLSETCITARPLCSPRAAHYDSWL